MKAEFSLRGGRGFRSLNTIKVAIYISLLDDKKKNMLLGG